jgi:hypothetical protein
MRFMLADIWMISPAWQHSKNMGCSMKVNFHIHTYTYGSKIRCVMPANKA